MLAEGPPPVHQQLQWIVTMTGSLFVLVMATRAFSMWIKQEYGAAATMLAGALVISVAVFSPGFVTGLADKALATLTGKDTPEPKPAPRPHPGPTGSDIPWTPLLAGLGSLAVLALLGGLAIALRAQHRRRTAERQRRADLETRHDTVRDAYADFTTDILAVLDRPALSNITVPQTERLILALDAARDARSTPDTTNYRACVIELEIAWKAADQHARKAGTAHLAPHEQRAIQQARALLATALDNAGNTHERHAAYQKAIKIINNIIEIPHEAATAIETATRYALPKK
ncbi:hypothetical protein [Actinacidiphila yeochonensis]|uniref:hypothetical protein n=1 Tax=Actinacidiphila yeochonensis TaxID=89050 RepID=UPI0012FEBA64|nr:hypothetical protein [Actinacidiphila yeochonensis]